MSWSLQSGEAEDGGDPWLCMAVPLRMPSRGLHLGALGTAASAFPRFYEGFTLTSSSGGERLPCPEGQDGPLPTPPEPSPHMRRVARLGLRSLLFYYHVDVCRHKNVAVAYACM